MEKIKSKLFMLLAAIALCMSLTANTAAPAVKVYAATPTPIPDVFDAAKDTSDVGLTGEVTIKTIFTYVLRIIFGFVAIVGLISFAKSLPDAIDALQNNQDPTAMKKAGFQLITPIVMIFMEVLINPIMNAIF